MTLFFIITVVAYLLVHLLLYFGLLRSMHLKQDRDKPLPKVTLIVAARNEEKIIARCISFLKKLEYDKSLLEIFLVNDKSDDRTKEIMLEETKGLDYFKVIDSEPDETGNLLGKPNAIDTAIRKASGEILFTTDADCEAPPEWLLETVSYYDEKTAIIGGFTNIDYSGFIFNKVQSLDWVYLHSLAAGSAGINSPIACIGNNMSFRKDIYDKVGGFASIPFSITEDLALLREVDRNHKDYNIKYPVDPKCLMKTEPCRDFLTLARQKKRWLKGATRVNWLGFIFAFEYAAINILFIAGYLFLDLQDYLWMVLVIFLSELISIVPVIRRFKLKNLLIYYPFFRIYFTIYSLFTPVLFLTGKKIIWKGRKF
ncbi:MAG: glycosyltransferase [Ignavibacteriae bacterium]|nr:glycosyltransferase [Ignavibacteriota bacterium]